MSAKHILSATRSMTPTPPHEINPEIPEVLSNVIMSLLIKDPAQRPNSAAMVAETLERALGVQKWEPHFLVDDPKSGETSATVTTILPDTLTRKLLRANNE